MSYRQFIWNPSLSLWENEGFLHIGDESLVYSVHLPNSWNLLQFNDKLLSNNYKENSITKIRKEFLHRNFILPMSNLLKYSENRNLGFFARYTNNPLDMQNSLHNANILVLGCGGIGSEVSKLICAAGIRYLTIVDFDIIEVNNLNRQFTFTSKDIGLYKTHVLQNYLSKNYPETTIIPLTQKIDSNASLLTILENNSFDLVICAIDNPVGVHKKVISIANYKEIPVVSSGVGIKYGHVRTDFPNKNSKDTSSEVPIYDNTIWIDDFSTNIITASIGTTNSLIASMTAHTVIQILTKTYENNETSIIYEINFEDMSTRRIINELL